MEGNLDILARTLYGECRGETLEGKIAVAYVIITRSAERKQSIAQVCLAPLQFSCWNQNDPNRNLLLHVSFDDPAFVECFGVACLVSLGKLENPVVGANHYITVKAPNNTIGTALTWPPEWAKRMKLIRVIGAHEFLRGL